MNTIEVKGHVVYKDTDGFLFSNRETNSVSYLFCHKDDMSHVKSGDAVTLKVDSLFSEATEVIKNG